MPAALRRMLALLTGIALASAAAAQPAAEPKPDEPGLRDQPVELTADALDYDAGRQLYTASGNVLLVQGGRTVKADWVAFNRRTGTGIARGNVEVRDEGGEVIRADVVEFDVNTRGGVVRQGSIDSPAGQFYASGEEIEKVGEDHYRFRGGVFTTCRCPKEDSRVPWRIRARSADLKVGGYGTVRDATFDVLDVPVLWLPWMIVPLRTERQSGFLFPEISFGSRSSIEVGTPFFWAARKNVNVTLTPRASLRRGYKQDVKVETLLGRESEADLFGAFAYDLDTPPDSDRAPYDRERWSLIGDQDFSLPADLRFRTDFRFVSDNDYPIDFEELRPRRADRWLESQAWLARGFGGSGRYGAQGVARFADDMQSPDDLDRDGAVLQRLPELSFAALPGRVAEVVPWLAPSLDVDYIAFQSRDRPGDDARGFLDTGPDGIFSPDERGFIDDAVPPDPNNLDPDGDEFRDPEDPLEILGGPEGDDRFQEGEPLTDEGHRIRIYPRLGAPFALRNALELYPEIGWYETLYSTRHDNYAQRGLPTARVDLRTRLRRHYGGVMHVVEPTFGYAYVGPDSQSGNPLLMPGTAFPQERIRSLELDLVTRDPADRIARANRVTWGAVQRLHGGWASDSGLSADLALLGSYEFEQESFGLAIADGGISTQRFGTTRVHLGVDPEEGQLSEALADWRWRHEAGHRVWLGYRFLRDIPDFFEDFGTGERFDNFSEIERIDQVFTDLRLQVTQRWMVGYRLSYSFESDLILQNVGLIEYLSKCGCWAAGVELAVDRASGVDARLIYRLVGLGDDMGQSPLLDAFGGL
jgi:hypothetical protein